MYKTIEQLVKDKKRIGFVFVDSNNNRVNMLDKEIKERMKLGEPFDIYYNGFHFVSKHNQDLTDLPQRIGVNTITGEKLKEFVNNRIGDYAYKRFVSSMQDYALENQSKVLAVSGLTGTGKTTGLLQVISYLNDYDNVVFISIEENSDVSCKDLKDELFNYSDKEYIFIDDFTRVKDFETGYDFLREEIVSQGKKVIVSGLDTFIMKNVFLLNTTQTTYLEARDILHQSLHSYIFDSGFFYVEDLKSCMDDMIYNLHISLDKKKLRTIVYRLLYGIVYYVLNDKKITNIDDLMTLFDTKKELNSLLCEQLQVDRTINIDTDEVKAVLDILKNIGLVITVNDLETSESKYYISVPYVFSRIASNIYDELGIGDYKKAVFVNAIIVNTQRVLSTSGTFLYLYENGMLLKEDFNDSVKVLNIVNTETVEVIHGTLRDDTLRLDSQIHALSLEDYLLNVPYIRYM